MKKNIILHHLALLLLMTVGATGVWGQTDYSGTYCIANDNTKNNVSDYSNGNGHPDNYYLCPATEYYDNGSVSTTDNGKPFLTTYKTEQGTNSIWDVEKVTDTNYYTFKLHGTSKYLTVNNSLTGYKTHRRRVHIEELTELSDRNYFTIERLALPKFGVYAYTIGCVDAYKNDNNQFLNPASGNFNDYNSVQYGNETPQSGGIVGFYTKGSNGNTGSVWYLEIPTPVLSLTDDYKVAMPNYDRNDIYYTTDGSAPLVPETGQEPVAPTYKYEDEFLLTLDATAIKAVAVLTSDHTLRSAVATLELEQCATPEPEYKGASGSVILRTATEGAHICYSTDGTTPVLSEAHGAEHEVEITEDTRTVVTAVAAKRGWRKSEPYQMTLVYMPTITLTGGPSFTYNGEAITPTIESVQVTGEENVVPVEDYRITSYYNNTNHGTATVTIEEAEGCPYKLYGTVEFIIDQAPLTEMSLAEENVMYNHLSQSPDIERVKAGELIVGAADYDVTISPSEVRNKGTYTVTVTAKSNSNFKGTLNKTFTITAKPLTHTDIDVSVTKENNALVVTVTDGGNVVLTEDTDYTFSDTPDGEYHDMTFTEVEGSNYSGTRTMTFVDVLFVKVAGDNLDYAATFAAKTDMATPAGMTAYIVTGLNAKHTAVELQAVDYLPESEPVLLLSNTNVDGFAKEAKGEGGSASVDGNKLKKTTTATHFDTGKVYLFYKGEFVLNAKGDLAANKIYLDLGTTTSPAPRLAIMSSELMGIGDIQTETVDETGGRWYRMDGLQLTGRPTTPGLYLHNRQKIVIRR